MFDLTSSSNEDLRDQMSVEWEFELQTDALRSKAKTSCVEVRRVDDTYEGRSMLIGKGMYPTELIAILDVVDRNSFGFRDNVGHIVILMIVLPTARGGIQAQAGVRWTHHVDRLFCVVQEILVRINESEILVLVDVHRADGCSSRLPRCLLRIGPMHARQ